MEVSGKCLIDFFRNIPAHKLSVEIAAKFRFFDKDKNGTLDKEEVREGMAEMGQRPDDNELDMIFKTFDLDGDGKIDQVRATPSFSVASFLE